MQVVLLTSEQKQSLVGVEYTENCFFNPVQDINNDWVISIEEQDQCSIEWVKALPLSEFLPKPRVRPF